MRVSVKREIPNHGVSEDVESTGSHCSVKLMGDEVTRGDIRALPHICRSLTDLTLEITDKDKMCYRYVSNRRIPTIIAEPAGSENVLLTVLNVLFQRLSCLLSPVTPFQASFL